MTSILNNYNSHHFSKCAYQKHMREKNYVTIRNDNRKIGQEERRKMHMSLIQKENAAKIANGGSLDINVSYAKLPF